MLVMALASTSSLLQPVWSGYEVAHKEDEDHFSFLNHLPSVEFDGKGQTPLDWDYYLPFEQEISRYCSVENCRDDGEARVAVICNAEPLGKRPWLECRGGDGSPTSKALLKKSISQFFYVPITQAAKELNVGLTLLKKCCRELGIRRWPHRKLMSLQTLIKNVEEMGGESESCTGKTNVVVGILEQERRLLEEVPDVQLKEKTKRLRQVANYKKRKLLGATGPYSGASCCSMPLSDSVFGYDLASPGGMRW